MAATSDETRLCRLEQTIGLEAACPEEHCPFWEPGGAALGGRCVFAGVDFGRDPDVARWLLGIRESFESPPPQIDD
jgi:hypothetical protein